MPTDDIRQDIRDLLEDFQGDEPLKDLFWSKLNYTRVNEPLSRRGWSDTTAAIPVDDPLLLAGGGQDDDFHVIYTRMAKDRLLLTEERQVALKLLNEHPYSLFVFSDSQQDRWHFVNVKYGEKLDKRGELKKRRLLRRISIGPEERLRTATDRISRIDLSQIDGELFGLSPLKIQEAHDEAFDVESVTKAFFRDYQQVFYRLQKHLEQQTSDPEWAHDYALQFLNRLMFLYFIQRKRWLGDNPEFVYGLWETYKSNGQPTDTFFDQWLSVLFLEAFNERFQAGRADRQHFPPEIREAFAKAPFLNGGLFSRNDMDDKQSFNVDDTMFEMLFDRFNGQSTGFLEHYNFTITEDTPFDQEVAVDPEMIGKVYESLVNITFEGIEEEDLRGTAGIFYTPRIEIDLMCRLSLVDWLANRLGDKHKPVLYEAVFAYDPDEKEAADRTLTKENLWSQLNDLLREATICDPACGSGSFLVGMLTALDDLQARANNQLGIDETAYERRKRIIGQSLYGVDVMPWAVHVAELRLWLQLVVETELKPAELKFRPLLPNLSFKVRQGDSLVQEIGGISFALHKAHLDISPELKGRLTKLKGKKLHFYNAEDRTLSEAILKKEEVQLFRNILSYKIHSLQQDIVRLTKQIETPPEQLALAGMETGKAEQMDLMIREWEQDRERKQEEATKVRQALNALTDNRTPFVWDIAFVEIFEGEKNGFDIVLGNPPYVRQEKIAPPDLREENHSEDEWRRLKKDYKSKLQDSVAQIYPRFFKSRKLDGKSDYYVYFYLHGMSLLNENGSFCFITSNSWLDARYGKDLQEFLVKHSQIKFIIDNQKKRSFSDADINTVIVLFSAPNDAKTLAQDHNARFIMFLTPFEDILSPIIFEEIQDANERSTKPEYRVHPIGQQELLKGGLDATIDTIGDSLSSGEMVSGPLIQVAHYIGDKWGGKYLRAPDIWHRLNEAARGHTVSLGQLAKGQRYLNTGGANGFFVIKEFVLSSDGLYYVITNTSKEGKEDGNPEFLIEREFAHPLIRSSSLSTLWLEQSQTDALVIDIPPDESTVRHAKALEYVRWGECKGFNRRSVTRLQRPWWKAPIQARESGPLLWLRYHNNVHRAYYNPEQFIGADAFYRLYPFDDSKALPLVAILNSTYVALWKEILGAVGYGLGVLGTRMDSMIRMPIPPLGDIGFCQELTEAFKAIAFRVIEPIEREKDQPERRRLDDIVFKYFNLSTEESDTVYEAVINLVEARLKKAGSV